MARQRRTLDALVRRAAQTPLPAAPVPSDMDATPGQEPLIDCVGCGVELPVVKAVRHFHKCFRKVREEGGRGGIRFRVETTASSDLGRFVDGG